MLRSTVRFLTIVLLLGAGPAVAASQQDRDHCANGIGEVVIAACSRVIDDASETVRNRAIAHVNRGIAYRAKNDNDRAIADHSEALKLDPKYANALYNRGNAFYAKKDYDDAIADYTEAIKLDPKFVDAYTNRGNVWHDKTDYDRAIADYDEAIGINPKFAVAYSNRGRAYSDKADYERAIADYTEAVKLNPDYVSAYNNRAIALKATGDYERAIADYGELIRLEPKNAARYLNRGHANFYLGKFPAAADDFKRAAELVENPYTLLWRYLARTRAGEDAVAELSESAARLKSADWPRPVIELFTGGRTLEEMRSAAAKPEERCEAAFYAGEWQLLHEQPDAGKTALQDALANCPKTFVEHDMAVAELKRAGPQPAAAKP
jgi:tetratricopeptide (TPR) repeat protein